MPEPPDTLSFELYRLAVEMADRISARRATVNSFFVTLQTALLAALGLSTSSTETASSATDLVVTSTGVVISATWWLQLRSYRDLNRAQFAAILELEAALPFSLFRREWEQLKTPARTWRPRYLELGTLERLVPGLFAVLHVALLAARIAA